MLACPECAVPYLKKPERTLAARRQVFLTEDYLGIVMEYASGGDMFQLVVNNKGLPENNARWYFQQLIAAVDYCHKMVSFRKPGSVTLV